MGEEEGKRRRRRRNGIWQKEIFGPNLGRIAKGTNCGKGKKGGNERVLLILGYIVVHWQLDLVNGGVGQLAGPLAFSIISGNLDSAFQVEAAADNKLAAQIRTNLELDAEIRSAYSLHILAYSVDGQRAECRLDIRVLDREDNPPTIRRIGQIRLAESKLIN
jgi:hypothetical protein